MSKTWRDSARPIIARVIEEVGLDDRKALRKALREAYPWQMRRNHPYKIWLDEIAIQTGKKKLPKPGRKQPKSCDGQSELF
jgi:hypothetical protein